MPLLGYSSSLDLNLAQVPQVDDPELYNALEDLYNAVQIVASTLDVVGVIDAASQSVAIILPKAMDATYKKYSYKRIDQSGNSVTVTHVTGEQIDLTTQTITLAYLDSVTVYSDGSNWLIL